MMNLNESDIRKLTHGITITKKVTQDVLEHIRLTSVDIENWIDHCEDVTILRYLSRIAQKRAKDLNEPDDDFRSRA